MINLVAGRDLYDEKGVENFVEKRRRQRVVD